MNVFSSHPFQVIVDYAHNPAGLTAQRGALHQMRAPGARLIGMVSVPGDRRDQDIREVGAAAAQTYDELYLREAADGRGRPLGEVTRLMQEGALQTGFAPERIHCVLAEHQAVEAALRAARPGDLVVLMPTDVEGVWRQVQTFVP
ncbi:hypothetical protein MF271_19770 (plasmid) [Deinococcus sp. KNUC1210]|uniref:glutamate ligase domain-containing protein n=1 Tax=Deinococcus sp. KNUC1210 TaxID=2917691 RepID=UPI001EEFBB3A|nr:cyanophycin synthetase [Deinococcus sp. KNUC1210]ULH17653.1 hypothetical protein MF271_19770 [Deinococcus sp. KNUC1210]